MLEKKSIRIIIFFAFLLLPSIAECAEYRNPAWMDNEHIICVKYVDTVKSRLFGWFGDITDARYIGVKHEIQIVSMDIEGKNEKVIKNIIIDRPRLSYKWREEVFNGVHRIVSISYSPKRRLIAFSTSGYAGSVFIINDDGTGVKKIVAPGGGPKFSPDGKYLQYTSNYKVWLYDLDTGEHKVLIEDAMGGPWSPDGKKIAFSRKEKDKPWQTEVYIYDLEEKEEKLYDSQISNVEDWTPDGELIKWSRLLKNPRVSPDGTKLVGEPYSDPQKKVLNYIGIADIDDKNLKILRFVEY